jgi:hypothetical protein
MVVVVVIAVLAALIVLSSIVGAWRGKRQFGAADDPAVERARAEAYIESQRHHHGGFG